MAPEDRPAAILRTVARIEEKVDGVAVKVADHEKKLRWITSVAILVVGAVGGPNAVHMLSAL